MGPSRVDGLPASTPLPHPNLDVRVVIGGKAAQVQYAGGAPGIVAGVMQVNVVVPAGISTSGFGPISLWVGTFVSPSGATIAVR